MGCGASTQLKALKADIEQLTRQNEALKTQNAELQNEVQEQNFEIDQLQEVNEKLETEVEEKDGCIRLEKMRNMVMEEMVAAEQVNVRLHVRRVEAMKTEMLSQGFQSYSEEDGQVENPLLEALTKNMRGTGTEVFSFAVDHMTEQIETCKDVLRKSFQARDKANKGFLRSQEFKAALRDGCQTLTKNECELLMLRFLEDDDITVDYNHFLLWFEQRYTDMKESGAIRRKFSAEEIQSALESLFAIWLENREGIEDSLEEAELEESPGLLTIKDFETTLHLVAGDLDPAEVMAITQGFREDTTVNITKLVSKLNSMSKTHAKKNLDKTTAVALGVEKFKKGGQKAREKSLTERRDKANKKLGEQMAVGMAVGKFKKGAANAKERKEKEQARETAKKKIGEQTTVALAATKFKGGLAKAKERERQRKENEKRVSKILASIALAYDELQNNLTTLDFEDAETVSQEDFIEQVHNDCDGEPEEDVEFLATYFKHGQDPEQVDYKQFLERLLLRHNQVCCKNGHLLESYDSKANIPCDRCSQAFPENSSMFGCLKCDEDVCEECRDPPLRDAESQPDAEPNKEAAPDDNDGDESFQPNEKVEVFVVHKKRKKEYKKWVEATIEEELDDGKYKVLFTEPGASLEKEIPRERIRRPGDESHPLAAEVRASDKEPEKKKRRSRFLCCGSRAPDSVRTQQKSVPAKDAKKKKKKVKKPPEDQNDSSSSNSEKEDEKVRTQQKSVPAKDAKKKGKKVKKTPEDQNDSSSSDSEKENEKENV